MKDVTPDLPDQLTDLADVLTDRSYEQQAIDPFAQQKLYEKWIKSDEWLLRSQALPLTVGVEPEDWLAIKMVDHKVQEAAIWSAMSQKITNDSKHLILNPDADPDAWLVKSADYYQWLNQQGITVPDALDGLMQFVMSVVAKPERSNIEREDNSAQSGATVQEQVLGAALNIVAKEPAQCRDPSGLMNGRALAEMINAQSVRWFSTPQAPMSIDGMSELLEKWLE